VSKLTARLLLIVAVLFMPLGMAPAAASVAHNAPEASMAMDHCDQSGSSHDRKSGIAECMMVCAAALPASYNGSGTPPLVICEPVRPASTAPLHGLHRETATPPPKRS
jgi:hypothetical protein